MRIEEETNREKKMFGIGTELWEKDHHGTPPSSKGADVPRGKKKSKGKKRWAQRRQCGRKKRVKKYVNNLLNRKKDKTPHNSLHGRNTNRESCGGGKIHTKEEGTEKR